MHIASRTVALADGLDLAWEEYGDAAGVPAIFCHGWPSSRIQGAMLGEYAHALGIRLISPDRPGIGRSADRAGRRLIDWPSTIGEFAYHLGLERFHVIGISGGGPYAMATAWALPERVLTLNLIAAAPPLYAKFDGVSILVVYRILLRLHRWQPNTLRWLFACVRPFAAMPAPGWSIPFLLRMIPKADAETMRDPDLRRRAMSAYYEAWRGAPHGVADDGALYTVPWGFELDEIRTPTQLWHGKEDRNFSWKLAEAVAKRLPHCEAHFLENEGHYSLPIRRGREILEAMLRSSPA